MARNIVFILFCAMILKTLNSLVVVQSGPVFLCQPYISVSGQRCQSRGETVLWIFALKVRLADRIWEKQNNCFHSEMWDKCCFLNVFTLFCGVVIFLNKCFLVYFKCQSLLCHHLLDQGLNLKKKKKKKDVRQVL